MTNLPAQNDPHALRQAALDHMYLGMTNQTLMAEEGGQCAGLVKVRESAVPELISAASVMEVQQLYVSTDFQRRGIGALLMDQAVTTARNRGVDGIWLSVWKDADWARNFYEKYGFTSQGEISFLLNTTEFTDLLMWLPVGD